MFGSLAEALRGLFPRIRPGGRLLFGEGFWERPPATELLGSLPEFSEITNLADVVDLSIDAGYRPLFIESATRGEWEEFESGFLADWEEWLVANGGHPDAEGIRTRSDAHRNAWLRGYRDVLGFCYLILGRPA